MLLQAKNIVKTFKSNKTDELVIFKDLYLEVKHEKIITIYGPSGVGKSTLLNLLGTVDTPNSGSVQLNELIYSKETYQVLRKKYISYMFQFHYLLPEFTVYENLEIALMIKDIKKQTLKSKITETLERFGIADKTNSYPHQLSGGEKQRVSLARAVVSDPLVVLADEPTGNLDHENSIRISSEIKKISIESGIVFIIASHDTIFKNISDKVCEIKNFNIYDINE